MSIPWCPICEHVTPDDPWTCGTCHEHGCDLCDDSKRFDEQGEHLCEACDDRQKDEAFRNELRYYRR